MCIYVERGEGMALARGMDTTSPFLPGRKEKRTGVEPGRYGIHKFSGQS